MPEGEQKFGAAHGGREHEVPHVEHGLNHNQLGDVDEKEQKYEQDLRSFRSLNRHQGQAAEGTASVPWLSEGI